MRFRLCANFPCDVGNTVMQVGFARLRGRIHHLLIITLILAMLCALFGAATDWLSVGFAQRRSVARPAPAKGKAKASQTQDQTPHQINPDGSLTGIPWFGEMGVRETTAEIMHRSRALILAGTRPRRLRSRAPEREEHEPINRAGLPQNPDALPGTHWPPHSQQTPELSTGVQPTSPSSVTPEANTAAFSFTPSLSFTAATYADTISYPPDTMGAVGATQFLLAVNGRLRVFDKTTGAVGALDADMDAFFAGVRVGNITTDPRVRFDRLAGRWFVLLINTAEANNRLLLAVSDGPTITASSSWTFFHFQQNQPAPTGDNGCFADYPTLGVDAHALYIGVNQFCGRQFSNTSAFVVRKSSVLGSGPLVVTAFRNLIDVAGGGRGTGMFTPQGVDNPDPQATEGYFIGVDDASLGRLILRRVSNPGGTPVLSPNLSINVLGTAQPQTVDHRNNNNGNNGRLDALDDRLYAAQFRNGSIWTAHNIAVNNLGQVEAPRTRNAVRWYEITGVATGNTPALAQAGTLFTASDNNTTNQRNFWIPALGVSGQGHMLLGCSVGGSNEYINAAISGRLATDPQGSLQPATLISNSTTPYNPPGNSGNTTGRRRWGDYSYTSVDPCDDMTLWTVQQFCDAVNSYGLRVVKVLAPPPATPVGVNPPAVASGQASVTVTVTGLADNGAGFYDPGDSFSCRLRAQVSDGVTVNNITYVNPMTVRLNLSTINASAGSKNITISNPDGQSVTANNLLTVGNCAYEVAANTQSFTAAGGTGSVTVTTASACGWTAVSNAGFITLNANGVQTGDGTVTFNVAPTTGDARTGTLTIAGQTITIRQSAGGGCSYALNPTNKQFSASGGTGSFTVTTAPECSWTASSNASFVNVLLGANGTGSGLVSFLLAPNTTLSPRTATINVAGPVSGNLSSQSFTITQAPTPFEIAVDDGVFETVTGQTGGGTSYRVNRLTPTLYPVTLETLAIYFPEDGNLKIGDAITLLLGTNPDGDANIDGTTFQTIAAQVQALGEFNYFSVPGLTLTQGDFVLGVKITHGENVFPFSLDTSQPKSRSYRSLDGVSFTPIDSLGVAGNYGIRAQLVRPPKLLVRAGSQLVKESCLTTGISGNNAYDPGETVTVNFSLRNEGTTATSNLQATLQPSGNVITGDQTVSYGALAPGATVTRAFTFTISGACGSTIPVTFNLRDGDETLNVVTFTLPLGTLTASAQTFSYAGQPQPIPDASAAGVTIPLTVSGMASNIADLNFRLDGTQCTNERGATTVGVDHSWVGDLVFKLTSPAGTTVTLINRAGGGGNGGRNFCQTMLDDEAPGTSLISAITANGAPYSGNYRPSNPLSAFDGENPNGTWRLTVIDDFAGDSGTVRAFSLLITGFACCQTNCLDINGFSPASGQVGSEITLTGKGFTGVTAVKFGTQAATFRINSDTSITATVPVGATSGSIILSKPGCVDARTFNFTVQPSVTLTPPSLTAIVASPFTMTVGLTIPQTSATAVTLKASNPALLSVPTGVTILANALSATFQVNGVAVGGPVTVTATLPENVGGATATATINVGARQVKVAQAEGSVGRTLSVPIEIDAQGNETVLQFSLLYDPSVLSAPRLTADVDTGTAQLSADTNQTAQGRLGVSIALPAGQRFAAGLRRVASVNFTIATGVSAATTRLSFGDQPVARGVTGANGNQLFTEFIAGNARLGQGYEGDTAPRSNGSNNGLVTISDWVQAGRFASRLDTPVPGSEFQRADSAPRETLGDGKLTLADWVQAGRYVAGFDAVTVAGGPTSAIEQTACADGHADCQRADLRARTSRTPRVRQLSVRPTGTQHVTKTLQLSLLAEGNENAISFSVQFDAARWRLLSATTGSDALSATLLVNQSRVKDGVIGLALALPAGRQFSAGTREIVTLQLTPIGRDLSATPTLQPSSGPLASGIVDAQAQTVATEVEIVTAPRKLNVPRRPARAPKR